MSSLVTIILFLIARLLYRKWPLIIFVPVFFSVVGCIIFLKLADLDYQQYFDENKVVTFLLGPAVVALGVLLHQHLHAIRSNLIPLLCTVALSSLASVCLVALLAILCQLPSEITASLIPLGITTPIAIEVSQPLGGDPAVTSVVVIAIGLMGNIMSPWWIRWFGIHDHAAAGLATGTVSHGIGTARAVLLNPVTGVFSGLAMCLNGVFTVFTAPLVWSWFF